MGEGLRDRKKRQTRAALCRAAVVLAAERGLDHVTVEDIAAAADVSARTFFNYFATKEEAVVGPDPELGPRIRGRVTGQPAELSPAAAVRAALVDELSGELADDRELWLLRMKVVRQDPVLLVRAFAGGEEVERQLAEGVAERTGLPVTDLYPAMLAAAAGAAFRVAITRWSVEVDPAPLTELFGSAMDLVAEGMAHPPS